MWDAYLFLLAMIMGRLASPEGAIEMKMSFASGVSGVQMSKIGWTDGMKSAHDTLKLLQAAIG